MRDGDTILVTGATGYIGGRLHPTLDRSGYRVRCLARRPEALRGRVGPNTEVVRGDVLDEESLRLALQGVTVAFYLVHSMGSEDSFEEVDRDGAQNFARAARAAGVQRIVYVGALGDSHLPLSAHLRSRHEVGRLLRESGVPVIELRASIVIGAGSLSFEMIRALVERLPVMITPKWVSIPAQPIAVDDLLRFLILSIEVEDPGDGVFEIGGDDVVTYGELMREYARLRGLNRWMLPVPVLTPRLSSLWLGLVTPLFARVGSKLIESIQHPTIVRDGRATSVFDVRPGGITEAMERALRDEDQELVQTRWSDALSSAGAETNWGGVRFGNRLVDSRTIDVPLSCAAAFAPIQRIGGRTGWYYGDWLWAVRGALDLIVGGVGMRRGRPHVDTTHVGDALDCWRVEEFEPGHRLLLSAEMKLPGRAWLEFEVTDNGEASTIRQTAVFDPIGLSGLAYWYGIYILHQAVFRGMLRGIARTAGSGSGGV
ncbi:MAG: SDR family oxidoreductase [Candidatus Binatia bacterium]|nr:SDR family oxidoreductase [Candidatus Binatia bacterium]